jgi:iron(III) transport system substrate-binding protein
VRAVFDTEATKTAGLVERLRREAAEPRCDVFWNNEVLRTILLAREGLFEPYVAPPAYDIPAAFRDAGGLWTGFAARARVLAYDPKRVVAGDVPANYAAVVDPRWRGQITLANPQFGTTGSHLALLFAAWGAERAQDWLRALKNSGAVVVAGNAPSRDRVLSGESLLAWTDTDDVSVAQRRGGSIAQQLLAGDGVALLPNTVSLVRGAPHPDAARMFLDFVLNPRVEALLASSPSAQIPVRAHVPVPAGGLKIGDLRLLPVSYDVAADQLHAALAAARELWGL